MDASTIVYDLNGRTLVDAANMALPVSQAVAALDGDLFVGANNLPNSFQQYSQNTLLYNADGMPNVNPQTGKQFTMGAAAQFLGITPAPSIFGTEGVLPGGATNPTAFDITNPNSQFPQLLSAAKAYLAQPFNTVENQRVSSSSESANTFYSLYTAANLANGTQFPVIARDGTRIGMNDMAKLVLELGGISTDASAAIGAVGIVGGAAIGAYVGGPVGAVVGGVIGWLFSR